MVKIDVKSPGQQLTVCVRIPFPSRNIFFNALLRKRNKKRIQRILSLNPSLNSK
jgi:hypothetical protein